MWRNIVNDDSIKLYLSIFPLFFYLSHAINFFGLLLFLEVQEFLLNFIFLEDLSMHFKMKSRLLHVVCKSWARITNFLHGDH